MLFVSSSSSEAATPRPRNMPPQTSASEETVMLSVAAADNNGAPLSAFPACLIEGKGFQDARLESAPCPPPASQWRFVCPIQAARHSHKPLANPSITIAQANRCQRSRKTGPRRSKRIRWSEPISIMHTQPQSEAVPEEE